MSFEQIISFNADHVFVCIYIQQASSPSHENERQEIVESGGGLRVSFSFHHVRHLMSGGWNGFGWPCRQPRPHLFTKGRPMTGVTVQKKPPPPFHRCRLFFSGVFADACRAKNMNKNLPRKWEMWKKNERHGCPQAAFLLVPLSLYSRIRFFFYFFYVRGAPIMPCAFVLAQV